jgi:putative glutathione S-transferase
VFGEPGGKDLTNTEGLGGPFPPSFPGNEPDPIYQSKSIRNLYEEAGDTDGKYTVPILWDKKHNTIVSNESSEIIRMLNSEFNEFAENPDLDLYPEELRDAIDKVNEWVYPTINNGVYRCGFATSQSAYDQAMDELTESFDRIDKILQKQRYIAGDQLSEADIRLFVTLLRFDEVYVVYFKTNTRSVATTPAVLNYCRDIYQTPGGAETVNMEQIKAHYYCSHPTLNKYSIIPRGPDFIKLLEEPHDRA